MTTSSDPSISKGMALIAAYRAARLRNAAPGEPAPGEQAARMRPAPPPSLAEIGFGPGMRIRLGQLGLHSVTDLAEADAARLRAALGDISRLIDVEAWISHARDMVRTMSTRR